MSKNYLKKIYFAIALHNAKCGVFQPLHFSPLCRVRGAPCASLLLIIETEKCGDYQHTYSLWNREGMKEIFFSEKVISSFRKGSLKCVLHNLKNLIKFPSQINECH